MVGITVGLTLGVAVGMGAESATGDVGTVGVVGVEAGTGVSPTTTGAVVPGAVVGESPTTDDCWTNVGVWLGA